VLVALRPEENDARGVSGGRLDVLERRQ